MNRNINKSLKKFLTYFDFQDFEFVYIGKLPKIYKVIFPSCVCLIAYISTHFNVLWQYWPNATQSSSDMVIWMIHSSFVCLRICRWLHPKKIEVCR